VVGVIVVEAIVESATALVVIGVVLFFVLGKKDEKENNNNNNNNNNNTTTQTAETEFLALSNKYVDAVRELWDNDQMVCQNATDATQELKPSELSDTNQYSGPAYYYVFIDSDGISDKESSYTVKYLLSLTKTNIDLQGYVG